MFVILEPEDLFNKMLEDRVLTCAPCGGHCDNDKQADKPTLREASDTFKSVRKRLRSRPPKPHTNKRAINRVNRKTTDDGLRISKVGPENPKLVPRNSKVDRTHEPPNVDRTQELKVDGLTAPFVFVAPIATDRASTHPNRPLSIGMVSSRGSAQWVFVWMSNAGSDDPLRLLLFNGWRKLQSSTTVPNGTTSGNFEQALRFTVRLSSLARMSGVGLEAPAGD